METTDKNLLISFSGGETSGYMTNWILNNWSDKYDNIIVVFANTGEEREETLEFVNRCDNDLGFNTVWVEADIDPEMGYGTRHNVVDFESAHRDGEPFEEMIKKYGIPNKKYPHCTRELKTNPIKSFVKNDMGWTGYYTAIGIRVDEFDRMSDKADEKKFIYPLVDLGITKQHVNSFWHRMPFRLNLKGYEGNCKACWKKSFRKLATIASIDPSEFDNMKEWEIKYENFTPEGRIPNPPYRFYRENMAVEDVLQIARDGDFRPANDDSIDYGVQYDAFFDDSGGCSESCEPFG